MKKLLLALGLSIFLVTGCGNKMVHVEGNVEKLISKVYEGIDSDNLPMMLGNIELTEENETSYIGEADIEYKEAIASESSVGSIAHSVVLIRMNEDVTEEEIESAKKELKENVNPRKWLCVGVEEVRVESNGDLILVVLNDSIGDTLVDNFKNLK